MSKTQHLGGTDDTYRYKNNLSSLVNLGVEFNDLMHVLHSALPDYAAGNHLAKTSDLLKAAVSDPKVVTYLKDLPMPQSLTPIEAALQNWETYNEKYNLDKNSYRNLLLTALSEGKDEVIQEAIKAFSSAIDKGQIAYQALEEMFKDAGGVSRPVSLGFGDAQPSEFIPILKTLSPVIQSNDDVKNRAKELIAQTEEESLADINNPPNELTKENKDRLIARAKLKTAAFLTAIGEPPPKLNLSKELIKAVRFKNDNGDWELSYEDRFAAKALLSEVPAEKIQKLEKEPDVRFFEPKTKAVQLQEEFKRKPAKVSPKEAKPSPALAHDWDYSELY